MLKNHCFDPDFKYCSKFLKEYLSNNSSFDTKVVLDIPSGNGRNTFLLAAFFKHVYAIDISKKYLFEIEALKHKYNLNNILTIKSDILRDSIDILPIADFICISHFYNEHLFNTIKLKMKSDAIIYIETPTCRGGNYLELPNKAMIEHFLNGFNVLHYKENICNSDFRLEKGISYTALIQKESNGNSY